MTRLERMWMKASWQHSTRKSRVPNFSSLSNFLLEIAKEQAMKSKSRSFSRILPMARFDVNEEPIWTCRTLTMGAKQRREESEKNLLKCEKHFWPMNGLAKLQKILRGSHFCELLKIVVAKMKWTSWTTLLSRTILLTHSHNLKRKGHSNLCQIANRPTWDRQNESAQMMQERLKVDHLLTFDGLSQQRSPPIFPRSENRYPASLKNQMP